MVNFDGSRCFLSDLNEHVCIRIGSNYTNGYDNAYAIWGTTIMKLYRILQTSSLANTWRESLQKNIASVARGSSAKSFVNQLYN